jgi:hypothetical protein
MLGVIQRQRAGPGDQSRRRLAARR